VVIVEKFFTRVYPGQPPGSIGLMRKRRQDPMVEREQEGGELPLSSSKRVCLQALNWRTSAYVTQPDEVHITFGWTCFGTDVCASHKSETQLTFFFDIGLNGLALS
jgi:hypothetical protein